MTGEWSLVVEAVGLLGFALYLASYLLLNVGRLSGERCGYAVMNMVAAACVLVSLTQTFNLASALIQISWIAISLFGIVRMLRRGPEDYSATLPEAGNRRKFVALSP